MTIRPALADDILPIVALAAVFHDSMLSRMGVSFDPAGFSFWLGQQIYNNPNFICRVAEDDDGGIVGMCGGIVSQNWMCPREAIFTENGWFVHPDHRSGTTGIKLLDSLLSELESCHTVTFALMQTSPPGAQKVLERRGFKPLETHYMRKAEW